jgi:P27 family predicted phage terminase small subunit
VNVRGRPRKSPSLQAAQGYPGKRKTETKAALAETKGQDQVTVNPNPSGLPDPPEFLGPVGQAVWRNSVIDMTARHVLKQSDHLALGRYCMNYQRWLALLRDIGDEPTYVTTTPHGQMIRKKPQFAMLKDIESDLRAWEDRAGLNPRFRVDLVGKLANVDDPSRRIHPGPKTTSPSADPNYHAVGFLNAPSKPPERTN